MKAHRVISETKLRNFFALRLREVLGAPKLIRIFIQYFYLAGLEPNKFQS